MNNKGFMMAEVVVVSAIVLVAITGLYISYNKIYSIYNARIDYYDVTTLYRLGYYRDVLIENDKIEEVLETANNQKVVDIYNSNNENVIFQLPPTETSEYTTDTVFLLKKSKFRIDAFNDKEINQTFKDYITFLSDSTTINSNYLMIMERCNTNSDNSKNIDDCSYAYLEIYDGNE